MDFFRTDPREEVAIKRMTIPEMQNLIRLEGGDNRKAVDCCPTIEEMSEPVGGRNSQDMYVELYRDGENVQRFFEYSCRPDVLDKPCRFIDRKLNEQSRCVQKFSYSYAIIQSSEVKVILWILSEKFLKLKFSDDNIFKNLNLKLKK